MNKKTLLRKDQSKIDGAKSQLRGNLAEVQNYVDWFNNLEFTTELKTLAEVKQFLTNPQHIYNLEVKRHLSQLTGLKTLPPDTSPLISMYQIPKCGAWIVSEKYGFEFLQLDKAGKLFYSQEIYDKIETDNNFYATPEQDMALQVLNETWDNVQGLKKCLSRGGTDNMVWDRNIDQMFSDLLKPYALFGKDGGNMTRWNLEVLEQLALAGFGTKNSINK